jgi:hypothetical protein
MWSCLTTKSFISPLPGYVENKAGAAETPCTHNQAEFLGQTHLAGREDHHPV